MKRSRLTALQVVQQMLPQFSRQELKVVVETALKLMGESSRDGRL